MKVRDLIAFLETLDKDTFIYLNCDKNIQDEFIVTAADDDNILCVPVYKFDELKFSQEFSYNAPSFKG